MRHLSVCGLSLIGSLLIGVATAADRPNVVVIISDDAGWADYGFMRDADSAADPGSAGAVPTPSLDQLAARGVTFTNAYTGSVCSPSRAMITTGQYGTRFGYGSNINSSATPINASPTVQGLPTEITSIWERMQGAGYSTAAIGKWHLGEHANGGGQLGNRPENQGIETFRGLWGGSRGYFAGGASGSQALRETLSDGAGGIVSNTVIENDYDGQYVTDVFGDQSVDYIRAQADADQPFFLYTSFTAPHTPMQATEADKNYIDSLNIPGFTNERRTYAAMQYAMDRNVGKIMAALDDPDGNPSTNDGIADNTLVIFINDNGGDCCDSGPNASDNGDLRNGKGSQFEGGMRVPMLIAGAGIDASKHGAVSADVVHSIDIVPTALVGAAGGSFGANEVIDGANLLPYINGTASGVAHESLLISRFNNQQSAVRFGQYKYMYQPGTGYQLYDLSANIGETNNLIDDAGSTAAAEEGRQLLAAYHVQLDKPRHDNQADETNQFDHFRFREESFTAASFSTNDAWTNGETGVGSFTATWRDGYADNELTFRAKSDGDYRLTNDLDSVAGLAHMASAVNLASAASALSEGHTGTVDGRALMLTNSRDGDSAQINLDASDENAGRFTFKIDTDIDLYDHLTIAGDGNQNFELNGRLREFRGGRNLTKTGTAAVTIGGPIEVTGTTDLQDGKVSMLDGAVGGSLAIRSNATLSVGGVGFNKTVVTPPMPADIVTEGLELHFIASLDSSGDATWDNAAGAGNQLSFASGASPNTIADATFKGITAAYDISSTGGAAGLTDFFEGNGTNQQRSREDATFEVWFHVADTAAGGNQVIFEAGAGRGVSFTLDGDLLSFNVDGDGTLLTIGHSLGVGWHQAVGLIDVVGTNDNAANDSMSLWVDNALVGTLPGVLIGDWAGGNPVGIGGDAGGTAGGSPIAYHDQIAVGRYYADYLFNQDDVDKNYQAALIDAGGGQSTEATLLEVAGDYLQETAARLQLDLRNTDEFDRVAVEGQAILAGALEVASVDEFAVGLGERFELLTAASIAGEFDEVTLPAPPASQMWQLQYGATSVALVATVAGDYNGDGAVDQADYTIWRDSLGRSVTAFTDADGNGDGVVDQHDYVAWKANFGRKIDLSAVQSVAAVPEPESMGLALISFMLLVWRLV